MSDQETIKTQGTKIDTQRDTIDDNNSEIQRLHDRMEILDQADIKNFEQHKQMMDKMDSINASLAPICDTYKTVGTMAKWLVAFLVFLSLLGGVIWTWMSVFKGKV